MALSSLPAGESRPSAVPHEGVASSLLRLARSTAIYGVGTVLTRALGLLLLPLFTSYLSTADYGVTGMLALVTFFAISLFSLGVGTATGPCYFQARDRATRDATIWTAAAIALASGVVLAAAGFALQQPLSRLLFDTGVHAWLVAISLSSAAMSVAVMPFALYLQFEERARTYAVITAAGSLIGIAISAILVVVYRAGAAGLVLGTFAAQAVTLAGFAAAAVPRLRFGLSRGAATRLLRIGIPVMPSFAVLFLLQEESRILLRYFHGLDAVGVYSVGLALGSAMTLVIGAFQNSWPAYFMKFFDREAEAADLFGRITTYYLFAFGGLGLCFFVAGRPLVLVLTTPGFHGAFYVVGLVATAQVLVGLFSLLLPGMYFAREVHLQGVVQVAAAVVAFCLTAALTFWLRIPGAALGLVAGYAVMAALQYAWNRWRGYFRIRYDVRRIGVFAVLYAAVAAASLWPREFGLGTELVYSTLVGLAALGGMVAMVQAEEWKFIRSAVARVRSRT